MLTSPIIEVMHVYLEIPQVKSSSPQLSSSPVAEVQGQRVMGSNLVMQNKITS